MSSLPKLRFPGFEGEWEEKSLGDVVCLDLKPIEKPAEAYVRLRVRSHGKGTFYETVDNPQTIEMETLYEVKENQLLVNITFAWEHAICVTNQEDADKIVSHRFPTYSFNEDNVPAFYKYYILLPRFKYYLGVASPGGAGRNRVLNKTAFLELLVPKPSSEEQTKIADFFTLIDKKITRQYEKVAALEQYKKRLMQKIFAREIRFKDDNGKDYPVWEKKSLSQVSYCLDSLRKPMNSAERALIKGNVPYYGANGIQGYINKYIFDEDLVLIAEDGGSFESFRDKPIAQFVTGKSWVNNHAHVLRAKGNSKFLFYSLVHKDIRKYICGTSRSKLTKENMIKILVPSPTIPEQTKIANLLSLYDRKIEKEKAKLDALREQKKGLLQQMFV